MIVVEGRALFEPQVVAVAIVPIVLEDGDLSSPMLSTMRRTTVVLPEPEPPATPITRGVPRFQRGGRQSTVC